MKSRERRNSRRIFFASVWAVRVATKKQIRQRNLPMTEETLTLITNKQLAKELSRRLNGKFTVGSVTLMRQSGKIPYVRLGYRTLRYDLRRVLAALAKREVKAYSTE